MAASSGSIRTARSPAPPPWTAWACSGSRAGEYGDFSLKLQWRDDAPGTGNANSGVFVRFPNVHDNPEESRPEWVAIKYGHEVQILDRPDGDMYKTGSIYGFDRIGLAWLPGSHPRAPGTTTRSGWWTSTTRSTATVSC